MGCKKMFFGEKEIFAIQLHIDQKKPILTGYSRVWIKNKSIGDYEDWNYLAPFVNPLINDKSHIQNKKWDIIDISKFKNVHQIFKFLTNYKEYCLRFEELVKSTRSLTSSFDSHMIFNGENFDRWATRSFLFQDELYFVWKKFPHWSEKNLYKEKTYLEKINPEYFSETVLLMEKYLIEQVGYVHRPKY